MSDTLSHLVDPPRAAQPVVGAMGVDVRLALAAQVADELRVDGATIIELAVSEGRQPLRFARRELSSALQFIEALPELAESLRARSVPALEGETTLEWAPYGVVLGWHAANSPVWVPTLVALSALVAGNTVVCRPSRRVRQTTGRVLEAIARPWPPGALTVADLAPGDAEPLLWHEGVDVVVAHASSTTCKRHLARLGEAYQRGARLRPYIAEGSGNDAFLILPGADIDRAVDALATAAFANSGQLCMAAKRIIVTRDLWPDVAEPLRAAVASLHVGEPTDERTDVVRLAPGRALMRALTDLGEAMAAGGEIVAGGGELHGALSPTVIRLPRSALGVRLWKEESFAPLRSLVVAEDEADAIALANDSPYGLGAAVFGGGPDVAVRLRGARIVIEEQPLYQDPHLVVGGVGDSGLAGARPKIEQLVYARRIHRGAREP